MEQTTADNPKSSAPLLERVFGLAKAGTDPRTEFVAGLTTFLTMVYIVFVNPQILGNTGMDKGAVFVATCIAAAVSTLVMALYANYPIALAPGMGLNAFFAFTVVLTMKYTWQQALAAVFCSGVIFFFISIFRIREYIINAIPRNLKLAISAGGGAVPVGSRADRGAELPPRCRRHAHRHPGRRGNRHSLGACQLWRRGVCAAVAEPDFAAA